MARTALVVNRRSAAADTIEEFYISPANGSGTVIAAFTASNDTVSSKSYKAYIFNSSGALVSSVIPQTIVVRDRANTGPTIIDQLIPAGGTLRVESSSVDGLNFFVTGTEQ
ncbi:MAG: hypothetical protein JKY86_15415 [Gammaproteobacteria bacterium]|nr:hypothetical protein [Gammaproteobacteria bacterium]